MAQCQWRLTSSCSGRSYGVAGAPHVRHFIMHVRRASRGSAPPLNCGVRRVMNVAIQIAAVCLVGMLSGCASGRHFSNSYIFGTNSLDLRPDGTFDYVSAFDELGTECLASGIWRDERVGGIKHVVLEVKSYANLKPENCQNVGLRPYSQWLVTHGGIVRVAGEVIKRGWRR
jgi:hypothetical protein